MPPYLDLIMSYPIIKKWIILAIKSYFVILKGQYVDNIILYHDGKVSYSDITIQYPGIQMPDPDFKLLHLLF